MLDSVIGYFQRRREPSHPMVYYAERNVRVDEGISGQEAPDPVRQSQFNDREAHYPKIVYTNIAAIESVAQDEFGFPLFAPEHTAWTLFGPGGYPSGQLPITERQNIQEPQSVPYGSMSQVPSVPATDYPLFPV